MTKEEFLKMEKEVSDVFYNFLEMFRVKHCTFIENIDNFFRNNREFHENINSGSNIQKIEIYYIYLTCFTNFKTSGVDFKNILASEIALYIKGKYEFFNTKREFLDDVLTNNFFQTLIDIYSDDFLSLCKIIDEKLNYYFKLEGEKDLNEKVSNMYFSNDSTNDENDTTAKAFKPEWKVPNDKIVLTSTPTGTNNFYKQWLNTKTSVKDRTEKISNDDILNLQIAFNTANSFDEFLGMI